MSKLYKYTLLNQDGTVQELEPCEKKGFHGADGLYELLDCSTIELIPQAYYPDNFKKCTVYGDEEGRYNANNNRNPHMKVLKGDTTLGEPAEWDCVGNLIKEEVYRGKEII